MDLRPDFDPGFSTREMSRIWSAENRVQRLCDVEGALAQACAQLGLIPADAAAAIVVACREPITDPVHLLTVGYIAGSPVIPLVAQLRAKLPPQHAAFVHRGATSQDIIDTALMLQMREALAALRSLSESLSDGLVALIERHRTDLVMGRTLMQPAVPMRFAWRVARWLDPVVDAVEELHQSVSHLPLQLGGQVGDLSSFGHHLDAVVREVAAALGLAAPAISWHTDRRPLVKVVALVERAAAAGAAIAADLVLLAQPELGEMTLPSGASSSMPHKKNPLLAVRALAAARACHGVAAIVTGSPPHELERAAGNWHAEWFAVPLVFHAAGAVLESTRDTVATSVFDAERAAKAVAGIAVPDFSGSDRLVERVLERYRRMKEV
jgi:3-carboxy-cis,cis-muconate cycloisomerase